MQTRTQPALDPPFATLDRYYRAIDRWDLDELVDCFSRDTIYGHPGVMKWDPKLTQPFVRGRDTVKTYLMEERKQQDSKHWITGTGTLTLATDLDFLERGVYYFAAVTARTNNLIASVCVLFQVDAENRISRYAPHVGSPYYNLPTSRDHIAKFTPLM